MLGALSSGCVCGGTPSQPRGNSRARPSANPAPWGLDSEVPQARAPQTDAESVIQQTTCPWGDGAGSCNGHLAIPFSQIPGYKGNKQHYCSVCLAAGKKVSVTFCCVKCSTKDSIVPVHQLGTESECINIHAAEPAKQHDYT